MLEVYIDGACEPNPGGTASYGVVVYRHALGGESGDEPGLERVWRAGKIVGSGPKMSNNVAEYAGLIAFLEWYFKEKMPNGEVVVHSDSQLLVNQMSGNWKVRKGLYVSYYKRAKELLDPVHRDLGSLISFKWIPREKNTSADALSVKALAEVGIVRRV